VKGLEGFFGSGEGILRRAAPAVRLMAGMLLLGAVLAAPAPHALGAALMVLVAAVALAASGLRLRYAARALALGLLLYAPLATLLAAPTLLPLLTEALATRNEPGAGGQLLAALASDPAVRHVGLIVLRGTCALLVMISAISTIAPRDVHAALGALPLPRLMRLIMLQVVQQTGMLLEETRRVRDAVAVRGGGAGGAGALLAALPAAWLPRVAGRAERVAMAMDARGYASAPLPAIATPSRWSAFDAVAIGAGGATVVAAILLRVTGG
jgi:energy-coupling factor transporter transmembrane protein EcfT